MFEKVKKYVIGSDLVSWNLCYKLHDQKRTP